MPLNSFSFGASNPGSFSHGGGAGAGKVSVHDLSFTKNVTPGTAKYYYDLATGKKLTKATIDVPISDSAASLNS